MRRKDREITDPVQIHSIIESCFCCRVGFYDGAQVYIVPLNFGFVRKQGHYTFYFHGAKEGRKIECIKNCASVGFELDDGGRLVESETACGCSTQFRSIIGNGIPDFLTYPSEKLEGLRAIMEHTTGKNDWSFDDAALQAVCIFKIEVTEISCKEHDTGKGQ